QGARGSGRAATPFVGRQQPRVRVRQGVEIERPHAPQHLAALDPPLKAAAQKADADNTDPHHNTPRTRLQLLPPKPKILLSTRRTGRDWFSRRIWLHKAESTRWQLRVPATNPCVRHIAEISASVMPAAPSACPVHPFVELAAVCVPNTS